jgi:hypothetical protein
MKKCIQKALVLGMLVPAMLFSAFEQKPAGARNAAMGGLSAVSGQDGWGAARNPALLLRCSTFLAGVSIMPGMFSIADLSLVQGMAIVPAGSFSIGFFVSRFGADAYREIQGGLSLAFGVAGDASFGASLQLYHLAITGYGGCANAGVDLGLSVQPIEACGLSLAVSNCTGATMGACSEEIPRALSAAVEWRPDKAFCMVLEARKESGFPLAITYGGEVTLAEILSLRAGCSTEFPGVSAGAGIEWSLIRFDYAWRCHATLGGTHMLSVTIRDLL